MRIDDAGPRTWLLAAAAGFLLLAWVLALLGMGGRIATLPDDPTLVKPLPTMRPAAAEPLGAFDQYNEVAARPLFDTARRPRAFFLEGQGDAGETTAFDYVLTSVLLTPNLKLAILQPPDGSASLRVRLGEAPEPQPAWRLVDLNARSAVFEGPEGRKSLDLRVYDGVGGAAPTRLQPGDANREPAAQDADANRSTPETRAPVPPEAPKPEPEVTQPSLPATPPGAAPATDQAQMEAIRQRIQQRRAMLRGETPTKPPAQIP